MRHSFALNLFLLIFYVTGVNIAYAQSPGIFFSTLPQGIKEGGVLTVDVKVQSSLQSVNAVSGIISFPPDLVKVVSVSKENSIIDLWTREPRTAGGLISFEGLVLNPGFQGAAGPVFGVTLEAKRTGTVFLNFTEGAILANDGRGTNVLGNLGSASFRIFPGPSLATADNIPPEESRPIALPVITNYSPLVESKDGFYIKGKGEPSALTKIIFKDVSIKSAGERLIGLLQTKKKKVGEVLVVNDPKGEFQYTSSKNLAAGTYDATPFLFNEDTDTGIPGPGVQFLVKDSRLVNGLVVLINVLGLLIPIVTLGIIIYFIPWYSFRKIRVIKKKLWREEEKLLFSEELKAIKAEEDRIEQKIDALKK